MPNFDSDPLTCDPVLFSAKNSPNSAKSNHIFPGKGRGDRALILTYLNSPMAEIFPHYCQYSLILVFFRGKREVKVGPKVQILGLSLFHKNSNPSKNFKTMFLFARALFLVRILAKSDHIWRCKDPKT